jgi:hypothetical protein
MCCQRVTFGAASYAFISFASVFKKALKALSHTFLLLSVSHFALVVRIRCRLALTAVGIDSLSCASIIALHPRPVLIINPYNPSFLYHLTHVSTLTLHMEVILPTSLEVRPSDLSNMLWQRIQKLWLYHSLTPNSMRCSGVSEGVFTCTILGTKIQTNLD